jgi:hypothetical protein
MSRAPAAAVHAALVPPADQSVPPAIETLMPAVVRALEIERGRAGDVTVVSAARRTRSAVWEISTGGDRYILKWLPRRAARERELALVTREVFAGDLHVRTPRVACNPTSDTFLVEKLRGESLQSICTVPPVFGFGRWAASRSDLLARVGSWLRRFHDAGRQAAPAPLGGVAAYVRNRAPALGVLEPRERDAFWCRLDAARALVPSTVHGDFTPHNILVDGETVAVIDMAGINEMEHETPCFDAAAMVVGLEESWRRRRRNYRRFSRAGLDGMVRAFLRSSGIADDDDALPVCYAVRHLARIYTVLGATGRLPGPRSWHVQRLRLAIERPEAILRLGSCVGR